MGFVRANITIINSTDLVLAKQGKIPAESVREFQTESLVDSGAFTLIINDDIRKQLGLEVLYSKPCRVADGNCRILDVAGPVEVHFANRYTTCEAAVVPNSDRVLLGAIPLEGMDVLIDPCQQQLVVNPAHPDAGVMLLM
ncbi:hypothetical protein FACS189443_1100 [Planctomycetales bacterium]|nr:hypothetical protein FACS189443_1100 [Planctomycetales bacterium]